MEKIIRKLKADEIDVKVKQVTEKGCLLLLYKTARVDMQVLDETYGVNNWQCDYKVVNNNLYCGIAIKNDNEWIWKWDCGIESKEDGEGNEVKGEASDAFKRAGFKAGIGRELYTTPFLWASVPTTAKEFNGKKKYELTNRFQKFNLEKIEYKENNISYLKIVDENKKIIIEWGLSDVKTPTKPVAKNIDLDIKSYGELEEKLNSAKTIEELKTIATSHKITLTEEQKKELTTIYNVKKEMFK